MRTQWRAGPFPDTAHFTLSCQSIAVGSNGNWMPVLEADVGVGEIHEQRFGLDAILANRAVCRAFTFEGRVAITIPD